MLSFTTRLRVQLAYWWPPIVMLAFAAAFIGFILFVMSRPHVCSGDYRNSGKVLYVTNCHLEW